MRCLYCNKGIGPLRLLRDREFCSESHRIEHTNRFRQKIRELLAPEPEPLHMAGFLGNAATSAPAEYHARFSAALQPASGPCWPNWQGEVTGLHCEPAGWLLQPGSPANSAPRISAGGLIRSACLEPRLPECAREWDPWVPRFTGAVHAEPRVRLVAKPAAIAQNLSYAGAFTDVPYPESVARITQPILAAAAPAQATPLPIVSTAAAVPLASLETTAPAAAEPVYTAWSIERAAQPAAICATAADAVQIASGACVPLPMLGAAAPAAAEPVYTTWCIERAAQPLSFCIATGGMEPVGAPATPVSAGQAAGNPTAQPVTLTLEADCKPALTTAEPLPAALVAITGPAFPVALESRDARRQEITLPSPAAHIVPGGPLALAALLTIEPASVPGPLVPATAEAAATPPAAIMLPAIGEPLEDEQAIVAAPQPAPLAQRWSVPQLAGPAAAYPWWPARPAIFAELTFPPLRSNTGIQAPVSSPQEPLAGLISLSAKQVPLQPALGNCRPLAVFARVGRQHAVLTPLVGQKPVAARLTDLAPAAPIVFDPKDRPRSNIRAFPSRRRAPVRRYRIAQYIGAMAAALLLAGVLLPRGGLRAAGQLMSSNGDAFRHAIASRAAFTLAEDFQSGLRNWHGLSSSALKSWSHSADGYMHPGQLGLYGPSLGLTNYRVEFLAQIESKSVDWVVRARDTSNYYAVKFNIVQPGPRPLVDIVRYPVVKGKRGVRVTTPVRIMVHANTAYWVSVDVHGNRFRAFIDGQEADFWTDDRLKSGGVGFFSEPGERARVYRVKIDSNDDFLGRVCAFLASKSNSATNHTEKQPMEYRYSASTEVQEPHVNGTAATGDTTPDGRLGKVLSKAAALHLEDKREEAVQELRAAIDGGERHPALFFAMGQLQYELQDYESAAQSYAQAAMLQPLHPTAHFNTGVCLGRLERWEESAEFFRVALANDPARLEAHLALGACLVRLSKQNEAIEAYDRYLARYPDHEEALFGKAVALQKHDRPAEAAELYRRLLARNPRSAESLSNLISLSLAAQDYEQVRLYAGRLADLHPRSQVALEGLAAAAFANGDHAAAAEYSRKLADIAPQVFENWFNLGVACHKSGDLRTATDAYTRATRIKADSAQAQLNLGVALHEAGDLKGARAAYEEALNLDAKLPGVHWNLGLVHEQSGEAAAAEFFYAQVPQDSPDFEDALFRMGHLKLQRSDYPGSIQAFKACLQHRAEWPEARLNLGITYWRSGDKEAARNCFQELNSAGAESKEALRGLAALALERQEYDKAFDIYHQLIDAGDRTPELLYNAGLICQKRGQAEDAAALYREALKADPGFGEALLNLGHALMAMGDEFEARSCWRRAVLIKPELAQHYFEPAQV